MERWRWQNGDGATTVGCRGGRVGVSGRQGHEVEETRPRDGDGTGVWVRRYGRRAVVDIGGVGGWEWELGFGGMWPGVLLEPMEGRGNAGLVLG